MSTLSPQESLEQVTIQLQERMTRAEVALEEATSRQHEAEGRYRRSERRFRVLGGVLLGAITVATILPFVSPAAAQGYGVTLTTLAARVVTLEAKTASMSVLTDPNTSQPTVRFSDVNVQIVSGSGSTEGDTNGRGNLIIGYNEIRTAGANPINDRTGSHNLVLGFNNNYTVTAKGGIIGGDFNTISGLENVVFGEQSVASGLRAVVLGGGRNLASGDVASITGGVSSTASGTGSSVSGGFANTASGGAASVSGGSLRTASTTFQWVGGSYSSP